MRFELRAECAFSGELERARGDIEALLSQAKPLLLKGAPKGKEAEAAEVRESRVAGKKLELVIESGRYVRAHDALFRLARLLSAELGKKHKLGLRGITAPEYKIVLPLVPAERVRRELETLPCELEVGKSETRLKLRNLDEASLRGRVVDRLVALVTDILERPPAPIAEEVVVRTSKPVEHRFTEDPFEVCKRLGWIKEFPARGQWIYTSTYSKLFRALEELVVERIALKLGFEEFLFPKLIPLEVMQKMPGYLDELPEGMYYVSPPPREPEAFAGFKRGLKLTKRIPVEELERCLKPPAYVLAPAQCEPFYEYFAHQVLRHEDLPIKVFDRSGWTYRWEGGATEGIVRVQEFQRTELTFIGSPTDVVNIRDEVRDKSVELADELGLEWRLLVATPFYMRGGGVEEDVADSRKVATYDLEAALPYKHGWTELGSFNVHRTKFVKSFKIKEATGKELWTGCCGFGSSRWVVGFLAQHGFDLAEWPKLVRDRMGNVQSPPKSVG